MQKISLAGLILFFNAFFPIHSLASDAADDKELEQIAELANRIKSDSNGEVGTNTYVITPEDRKLFNKEIQNAREPGVLIPKNIHKDTANNQAREILEQAMSPVSDSLSHDVTASNFSVEEKVLVFVSWSMGLSTIKGLLKEASQNQNVVLVFRGVKDINSMGKSLKEISDLASAYSPTPNVMLNPTYFRRFNITQVPSVVIYDEKNDKLLGKVVGLSDGHWIASKMKESVETDFGIKGPTIQIAELDIIEVMKDRASKIDWAKKKEDANNRFWKNQEFILLPRATKSITRALDPSIQVTEDILDGFGATIVSKGTIINPLDLKSFDKSIIVFDPIDKAQLDFAKGENSRLVNEGRSVILIATQFDKSKDWDSYKNITAEFNAPVFKLTPDVKSRFLLSVVPSVITADKKSFFIKEVSVKDKNQ
ncbi:MAG: hypothetical protein EOO52_12790 [Gammaproteobacteria bacterium]|nr:MAG: hypothetical protein EOO52_12790 [Gammaproteobacteria bacterium]